MSVIEQPKAKRWVARPPLADAVGGLSIGPDDTVVDVGCGNGPWCTYAATLGAAVIGLDVEPTLIDEAGRAMEGLPARSWRGIVSECDPIPLPDQTATLVICTEVLEHVPDPARLAAELVRIGKPGARYLVSVPDPVSESLLRHFAAPWYWRPPFHRRVFGRDEFARLLRDSGLKVERRGWFGFYYTIHWILWSTLDVGPYDAAHGTPMLENWSRACDDLRHSPELAHLGPILDRTLPKSQVLFASKPGGPALASLRRRLGGPADWKRWLKLGSLRVGGLEFSWAVRRVRQS